MTRLTALTATLTATLVAALALAAGASAAGPTLGAGAGCSVACIDSALVTATASSASVEVKTSVPTSVSVTVAKVGATLGLAAGPAPKHVSVPAFLEVRTLLFSGLEPATAYRIVVSARDLQGHVQTRSGTFTTRTVKVAVDTPGLGLSAGLGCKADCIEKGTLKSDAAVPGRARLELRTSVPATFQVKLVATDASGTVLHQLVHSTGSRKTTHTTTLDGLLTGTTYAVTAKATDEDGRIWVEQGTFRTRSAEAVVTYHKILVIDDGDKGIARGEVAFDFLTQGFSGGGVRLRKARSGETLYPTMPGTTRPGYVKAVSIDGRASLELIVRGFECDATFINNCAIQAGLYTTERYAGDTYVTTKATVDLRAAFTSDGALPPGYGSGLPAGHDAYAIWATTQHSLKYRVFVTVDVRLAH